ncbi:MAG: twin-arginine translocase TatA/TatE family subunit [Candidatus Aureabacteria bacterium]|nr:twin-arginine translocase TatA/TatE family subunit [Candidatus Auribacterota bacterium]
MTLMPLAFFQNVGLPELIVILFIILLLFGAKRLPEMMKSLGKGVKEFKKGMEEGEGKKESTPDEKKPPTP